MSNAVLSNFLGAIDGHESNDSNDRVRWYLSASQATRSKTAYGRITRTTLQQRSRARFQFSTEA